jgi:pectin methylesterase-like acyl-CoA thioesterase
MKPAACTPCKGRRLGRWLAGARGALAAGLTWAALGTSAAALPAADALDWLSTGTDRWVPAALQGTPLPPPDLVVAADGSGTHTTLQAALDALPARGQSTRRTVIVLRPGTYRERPCLRDKAPVLIAGDPADAAAVRIVGSAFHALPKAPGEPAHPCHPHLGHVVHGTSGSATFVIASGDVQVRHLTVENDARRPDGGHAGQAVALTLRGDRLQFDDVRVLGGQDTLLTRRPPADSPDAPGRAYIDGSLIAGDVDFVFGDGTLVIDRSTLRSRAGRPGVVLAPSTRPEHTRGILVTRSHLAAEPGVPAGSVSLGRAWDEGVPAGQWQPGRSPNGVAVVRQSLLGPHLVPPPRAWAASTAARPFDAQVNRLRAEDNRLERDDPARDVLPEGWGWASVAEGVRGGADALPRDVHVVRTRGELRAALAPHSRPRIVKIDAFIDLAGDDDGRPLPASAFADPAFRWEAFAQAFAPSTWGPRPPEGPLEDARRRSAAAHRAHVTLRVPSRTTLIGTRPGAGLRGGTVLLERVSDVIVRNLRLSDAHDPFPAWDPADGREGSWNSLHDNLSLVGATRVWIDRCTFDDGDANPATLPPEVLGQRLTHHDGLLDITRESDLVTVSASRFLPHDKTSLVGGSDRHTSDEGRLRVTFLHNVWDGVKERAPRVRHGQVHVVRNVYRVPPDSPYGYSLGLGVRSRVLADHNVWLTPGLPPQRLVRLLGATHFVDRGTLVDGRPVSLHAALRGTPEGQALDPDVGWSPPYSLPSAPPDWPEQVLHAAGAGRLEVPRP